MDTWAEIEVRIEAPREWVTFAERLSVCLDCPSCRRAHRTIVFEGKGAQGVCTPTDHAFAGTLLERVVSPRSDSASVTYRIGYLTAQFMDPKRHEPSVRHPTWARVGFRIGCPKCGHSDQASIQNNIVRPYCRRCSCGQLLYEAKTEQPSLRAKDANGNLLYEQEVSRYELLIPEPEQLSERTQALLSEVLARPWCELRDAAHAGKPVYQQNAFEIEDGLRFARDLDRMAFALLREGAEFAVMACGRNLRSRYERRLQERTAGQL